MMDIVTQGLKISEQLQLGGLGENFRYALGRERSDSDGHTFEAILLSDVPFPLGRQLRPEELSQIKDTRLYRFRQASTAPESLEQRPASP